MFARQLDLGAVIRTKSALLLGPRQTGKSTLLRQSFPGALFVDLLEPETFRQLSVGGSRRRTLTKEKRPRRDLNPCRRRERPVSWARLDDGDVL